MLYWILGILAALFLLSLISGKGKGPAGSAGKGAAGGPQARIRHPHYISADEYECGTCGRRFRNRLAQCPGCGVRFDSEKTDQTEFDEEMDEAMDMDEEDGL